jgi:very-short-patch-repair endonuclease
VEGATRLLTAPPSTFAFARKLRRRMSLPEVLLWEELRRRPHGLKFRRQHPVGLYVADFFCAQAHLAIEVDGEGHGLGDQPERDERRDIFFRSRGIRTLRIPAREVLNDIAAVVEWIVAEIGAVGPLHHASHGPPPPVGEDWAALTEMTE